MTVSQKDAKVFFDLMWALQFYVNQKYKIDKSIKTLKKYYNCPMKVKYEVRKKLFEDINVIDLFVQENPQNFPEDHLSIAKGWKNFIQGNFQIERFLKTKAIFINENNVYGVLGLYEGFDEMIHKSRLPLYVETVLLPFKGKIVYDGLFQVYNVYFGGGSKRRLKEIYMTAKQNNRIIDSFELNQEKSSIKITSTPEIDWTSELQELADRAKKLKGSSNGPAIYSPAFSLIKASIEFAQEAASNSSDLNDLYNSLKKVQRAFKKTSTVLKRQES